jgi:hypothetical protein
MRIPAYPAGSSDSGFASRQTGRRPVTPSLAVKQTEFHAIVWAMPEVCSGTEWDRPRILEAVRRYWGHDALRPLQEDAIRAGLDQRDSQRRSASLSAIWRLGSKGSQPACEGE